MPVNSVSSININNKRKRPLINAKSTGYVAAAGMGLTALSAMTKDKTIRKSHKIFALISLAAMLAHIYLVSSWRRK